MTLNKIIEVTSDGKFFGKGESLYNAFVDCLSIEKQVNKILGDDDFPLGSLADVWLSPESDPAVQLQDADMIAMIAIQTHHSSSYIYAFEYHNGTLLFGPYKETALLVRLNQIKELLYAGFGKAMLNKKVCVKQERKFPLHIKLDLPVYNGWKITEVLLGGLGPLCSVVFSDPVGNFSQMGFDLDKSIFIGTTPVMVGQASFETLVAVTNEERRKVLRDSLDADVPNTCGAV